MYLDNYINEIKKLCQANSMKTLYAFGSVLTDRFNEKSDIDLLIDIDSDDPSDYSKKYFNVSFALQDMIGRKIDLLESISLRNKYLIEEIDRTKFLIYGLGSTSK
jgi:predicted nucleotidyltransferase